MDGLSFVRKISDMLHVKSYYQNMLTLSIRSAAQYQTFLKKENHPESSQASAEKNAVYAREKFKKLFAKNAPAAEKVVLDKTDVCGFSTFVINLDRRPDRLQQFLERKAATLTTMTVNRFSAIDGQVLSSHMSAKQLKHLFRNNDFGSNIGAMGCALSHLTLWKQLLNDNEHDTYLILEDDVQFLDNFSNEKWLDMYYELNLNHSDWDSCLLGYTFFPWLLRRLQAKV